MTTKQKLEKAMDLLNRVEAGEAIVHRDFNWYRDFYLLTGDHMVRTDEGWEDGDGKQTYIDSGDEDAILEEVNAPAK